MLRIGLVEDNPGDARLIQEMLREPPITQFRLTLSPRVDELLESLERDPIQVLLPDLGLPDKLSDIAAPACSADALVLHMAQDKKAEGVALTFVLARALGEAFVAKGVDAAAVRGFLVAEGAQP